ncbi:MAG: glutaredoxin family protein [Acidobacteriia bacterium]|nr:glutaredoxin family protein [Terriglobia bacterium]
MVVDVVLYTKPGCCLCDVVKEQLTRLRATHPFGLREVNILDDPEAHEKLREEIPVVFMGGKKAFKYRLDEKQFIRRLGIRD